jgi:hypothetical protein
MSRRKLLALLASMTAALAIALPASASAATVPVVPPVSLGLQSGSLPCLLLVGQIQLAAQVGNTVWANVLSNVFVYSGCGGAAI